MAVTYEIISTTTISTSGANSVTFSAIPQTYTDLNLVIAGAGTNANDLNITFNGDTSASYQRVYFYGDGASVYSGIQSARPSINAYITPVQSIISADIGNYSSAVVYKTALINVITSSLSSLIEVGAWIDSSAITSVGVNGNLGAGCVISLYGIKAA